MSRLQWHLPTDQTFEIGLDRGVLYPDDSDPVVWNGLISVDDTGESEVKDLFIDGVKFLSLVSPRDWQGTISAYTFPDAFAEMVGLVELGDGLYADSQRPARFGLSYRTMVSAPNSGDDTQHYKIHIIYAATAQISDISYMTLSADAMDPTAFSFDLTAVPQIIPGARPTAHLIADTRKIDPVTRATLENILYGSPVNDPRLPTITELVDLLYYSGPVVITDNGDGTWTARGSNRDIQINSKDRNYFTISNVEVEFLDNDTYLFVSGDAPEPMIVRFDEEGYYFTFGSGKTGLALDTDGTPYFQVGKNEVAVYEDTDGVPYFGPSGTTSVVETPSDDLDGGTVINPDGTKIIDGGAP